MTNMEHIADAFEELISPHLNRADAKKILDGAWLPKPTKRLNHRPGSPRPIQAQ